MTTRPNETAIADRPCPICGERRRRVLHRQRFKEPAGAALSGGYSVCCCMSCGFVYADGVPPQEVLDHHYRDRSKYGHAEREGLESPDDRARFEAVADVIEWHLREREARILDLGASTGGFLDVLKRRGYTCLLGLDPSPACAEAAQRIYGVEVRTLSVKELARQGARFDLVVALAVLEHVRDLGPFAASLRLLLDRRGAAFVQVPDAERFSEFVSAPFQQFSTEHINYFSSVSLGNLLAGQGMTQCLVERGAVRESPEAVTPVLNAIFRQSAGLHPRRVRDDASEAAVLAYVESSKALDERVRAILSGLKERACPILVWGTGTHTQRLLAERAFEGLRVAAYVDSNPHHQGKTLDGRPVLSPQAIRGRSEAILVSSQVFQGEIVRQIQDGLKLGNEVITLYA